VTPENTPSIENPPRKWLVMTAVGLGVLMATLDVSIVNVSLPTLVEKLNTNFATIQWVIVAYILVVASLMLGVARLGDMFGHKKLYAAGMVIFTTASLLCGLAPSVEWLIGFRALQGSGAVMMQALGVAIVTSVFPGRERGRALGIIGGIVSVGLAMGPAIGGILIGYVGWRSIFLVNVPLGIVAFIVVLRFVPRPERRPSGQRFDFPGALLLFFVLAFYALGMTLGQRLGFGQSHVLGLLIAAGIGLIIFITVEIRTSQPMLETKLFRNTLFSINLVMGWLTFIVVAGTFVFPFYLELVLGLPTEKVGLLMIVVPLTMGIVAPISGTLSDRFGPRGISVIGLMTVAGGCLAISTLQADTPIWAYLMRTAPMGIGMGLFQSPNNSAVMGSVPPERLGVASGLLALSRTMGHTTGIPLVGVLFTGQVMAAAGLDPSSSITQAPAAALVAGIRGTYRVAALVIIASTLLSIAAYLLDRRRRGTVM
jgi:EmrB/QacA subfamily drug resistance transporter